jgi:hypothetical protein
LLIGVILSAVSTIGPDHRQQAVLGVSVPLLAWTDRKPGPVDPRKMTGAEKPGGERNIQHRQRRLAQQPTRMVEPYREEVALQRGAELVQKKSLEMTCRNSDRLGEGRCIDWLRIPALQQRQRSGEGSAAHIEPCGGLHSLRAATGSHRGLQKPFTHSSRKFGAIIRLDQSMHEVERGDPAGARESVTIDLKQGRADVDLGKRFPKCCDMFPVNGAAVARHYACARKYPCSPGDTS